MVRKQRSKGVVRIRRRIAAGDKKYTSTAGSFVVTKNFVICSGKLCWTFPMNLE